jgi:hypothetical protein
MERTIAAKHHPQLTVKQGKAEFADRSNCKITPDDMQMQHKQLSLDSHRENLACKPRVLLKQLSDVVLHFSQLFLKIFLGSLIIG